VPHDCAGFPEDLKRLRGQGLFSQGDSGIHYDTLTQIAGMPIFRNPPSHKKNTFKLTIPVSCSTDVAGAGRSSWIIVHFGKIVFDQTITACLDYVILSMFVMLHV
jgi:hypothetical protein